MTARDLPAAPATIDDVAKMKHEGAGRCLQLRGRFCPQPFRGFAIVFSEMRVGDDGKADRRKCGGL